MAAIDRLYGTRNNYILFYVWCANHIQPSYLLDNFYWGEPYSKQMEEAYANDSEKPIASLSSFEDHFLMRYCWLPFIEKYLKSRYGKFEYLFFERSPLWLTKLIEHIEAFKEKKRCKGSFNTYYYDYNCMIKDIKYIK